MRKSKKGPTTIRASTHHFQRPFVMTNANSTHFPLQMPQTGSHKANENLRKVWGSLGWQEGKERLDLQNELIFFFHDFHLFPCSAFAFQRPCQEREHEVSGITIFTWSFLHFFPSFFHWDQHQIKESKHRLPLTFHSSPSCSGTEHQFSVKSLNG